MIVVASTLVFNAAHAEVPPSEAAAAELFRAGAAALGRRDYKAAARAFEEAHARAPRAQAMYNAGLAWAEAGEPERAADALATALLLSGLREDHAAEATRRLKELESGLGVVHVDAHDARIDVAHVNGKAAPLEVHLPPGSHTVKVTFAGGASLARDVTLDPGKHVVLAFQEPPAAAPPRAPALTPPRSSSFPYRTAGYVSFGIGAGAGIASGVLGALTVSRRDAYDRAGRVEENRALYDEAVRLRTFTNIALVAATVLVATGAVLLLVAPRARGAASALPNDGALRF